MGKDMERVEQFEKMMAKETGFIQGATGYIYDHIEDPSSAEMIECTRAIHLSNVEYLTRRKESIAKLERTMASAVPITISAIPSTPQTKQEHKIAITTKNIQELIDRITYSQLDEDTIRILESQSHDDIIRVKLYFYKLIIDTKRKIQNACISNPLTNIKMLQSDLETYLLILDFISEFEKNNHPTVEIIEDRDYSNILFAPNGKRSTYILEDIIEFPDKAKEIKLIIDKMIDGYFLKTKDTKRIEGYQENLFEYKHPNGIRILYVVEGNIIIICSLFMKDKQKSSRITNEYDESIKRYYFAREYVISHFNDPDFHIEQSELIGEIYQQLDVNSLTKKVGDE